MNSIDEAFEEHGAELLRHATVLVGPVEAADLVSDIVVAAISDRRWAEADKPIAYLHRSLLNAARMRHRTNGRRVARERRNLSLGPGEVSPSGLLDSPEVRQAIEGLSPQQRAVIYFAYWEDLRPSDIATILGIGEGSVRRHLARARKNLKEALHEYQH